MFYLSQRVLLNVYLI